MKPSTSHRLACCSPPASPPPHPTPPDHRDDQGQKPRPLPRSMPTTRKGGGHRHRRLCRDDARHPNVTSKGRRPCRRKALFADPAIKFELTDHTVDVAKAGDMAVGHVKYVFTYTDPKTKALPPNMATGCAGLEGTGRRQLEAGLVDHRRHPRRKIQPAAGRDSTTPARLSSPAALINRPTAAPSPCGHGGGRHRHQRPPITRPPKRRPKSPIAQRHRKQRRQPAGGP